MRLNSILYDFQAFSYIRTGPGLNYGKSMTGFRRGGMILLLAIALTSCRHSPPPGVEVHEEIAYLKDDDPLHRLDIYRPEGKDGVPVLLFIHGGGWRRGDKQGS